MCTRDGVAFPDKTSPCSGSSDVTWICRSPLSPGTSMLKSISQCSLLTATDLGAGRAAKAVEFRVRLFR